jgi:uncharacterized protein
MEICGGGLYPHRYRSGEGFRNPSVYCADMKRLIGHVRKRLITDVSALGAPWAQQGAHPAPPGPG